MNDDEHKAGVEHAIAINQKTLDGQIDDLKGLKQEFVRHARFWTAIYYTVGGLSAISAAIAGVGALDGMSSNWVATIAIAAAAVGATDKFLGAGKVLDRKQAVADRTINVYEHAKALRDEAASLIVNYTEDGYLAILRRKVNEYEGFGRTERAVWESIQRPRPPLVPHGVGE